MCDMPTLLPISMSIPSTPTELFVLFPEIAPTQEMIVQDTSERDNTIIFLMCIFSSTLFVWGLIQGIPLFLMHRDRCVAEDQEDDIAQLNLEHCQVNKSDKPLERQESAEGNLDIFRLMLVDRTALMKKIKVEHAVSDDSLADLTLVQGPEDADRTPETHKRNLPRESDTEN
ncbi:hypothetical protein EGW08_021459 [Elysia chlorotica]|uniref:Uncharacterized protein n=1 Tax=Elysia chlorotica TaxID=188477 RepID=A0A3S0ZAZ9_ELYCH|nr:hypothetical protein EGW08_021459 [Elysia chlorotica]